MCIWCYCSVRKIREQVRRTAREEMHDGIGAKPWPGCLYRMCIFRDVLVQIGNWEAKVTEQKGGGRKNIEDILKKEKNLLLALGNMSSHFWAMDVWLRSCMGTADGSYFLLCEYKNISCNSISIMYCITIISTLETEGFRDKYEWKNYRHESGENDWQELHSNLFLLCIKDADFVRGEFRLSFVWGMSRDSKSSPRI